MGYFKYSLISLLILIDTFAIPVLAFAEIPSSSTDYWEPKPLVDFKEEQRVEREHLKQQLASQLEIQLSPAAPFIDLIEKELMLPLLVQPSGIQKRKSSLLDRLKRLQVVLYGTVKTDDQLVFLKDLTRLFPKLTEQARSTMLAPTLSHSKSGTSQSSIVSSVESQKKVSQTPKSKQGGKQSGSAWEDVFEKDPFFNAF